MSVLEFPDQLELFARTANREHALCVERQQSATAHAIAAGEALLAAKDELGHGEFLPWLSANFEGSERTAQKYMALARNPHVDADLPLIEAYEAVSSTAHLSSAKDEWATPQGLYDQLDAEFGFTLDVCATADNAKCERFFAERGLEQDWSGETCWMNPPYSEVALWMEKAASSGTTVVCLVPCRTDVGWFWDYASQGEIRLIRGRLHFVDDQGNTGPAPFPSCLVVFGKPPAVTWYDRT